MTGNGNRADISMFETLQANQHTKTGVSQMAVFNDLNAVKAASDKFYRVAKAFDAFERKFLFSGLLFRLVLEIAVFLKKVYPANILIGGLFITLDEIKRQSIIFSSFALFFKVK
jgi:hypothetical protein